MLLDLLDQSYLSKAPDQNQAQLINMYLEQDPAKGKYKIIALPMHGLTEFCDTTQSSVRELYTLNGVLYSVAGANLYSIASNGTITTLNSGGMTTTTGPCKMRAITGGSNSNHQLCWIDGSNGYTYNIGTNTFYLLPTNTVSVGSITVVTSGSGYTAPTVTITDSTGTGATATAQLTSGAITGFTVVTTGANYTNPSVVITDSTGTGGAGLIGTNGLIFNSFPSTAIDIENQDDYIICVQANSMSFQISNVSDASTWDSLNFDSKTGQPDNISAVLSHEGRLWFYGTKTTETWLDTGGAFFPFQRDNTTFLHYGNAGQGSTASNGNYFIFLSSNGNGGYSFFQTQPRIYYYNPSPVSTPPIDTLIQSFSTVADCRASIYNLDGHELYTATFPTANVTVVYDIPKTQQADQAKGAWYYRQSYNTNTSSYGRFLGSCQAYCYGKNFVGDFQSGKIYYQDNTNFTENGTPILRQFISPPGPTFAGGKRVVFSRMQIDVQTGVGSNETFTLEKSVDNGATWRLLNTFTVPPLGGRLYQTRLGSSRFGMIFRISTTMNAKFCLLGFQCEMTVGAS